LEQVIGELKSLTGLDIRQVKTSHNMAIYFIPENRFSSVLPQYRPINYGFFWTWINAEYEIIKAVILISSTRINQRERAHLIREELTQSLGLMNDSSKYINSMFQSAWTHTTSYSPMDVTLIKLLYRPDIQPGMSKNDLMAVLGGNTAQSEIEKRSSSLPAMTLCVIFLALSVLHIFWALGGKWGFENAIPTRDGVPLFTPGAASTLLIAFMLLTAAFISLWRGIMPHMGPTWIPRLGVWIIAFVFAARSIGDFRYCGFFKRIRSTPFARNDTLIYSPLCVCVSALSIWLAIAY
jgi:hypothetical protein